MSQGTNTSDFAKMSVEDRLTLIGQIWDSIEAERLPIPISEARRNELDRRLAEYESTPEAGIVWEDVKRKISGQP
jgi:putative addiction module component (TIGR02574 family)